jgi:outer membrane receptor for ferrienterochelin and colicins
MPCLSNLRCLALLLASLPASGAERLVDRSLEELMSMDVPMVTAASKFRQKATDAPASVSVISAKEFRLFGYRNLAEALNAEAGVHIQYDRLYQSLGVRGFQLPGEYNNRVAFLFDGARMNDPVYSAAPVGDDFYLDLDLVDRVEFIRGASSSLYGNNAFYGVINVIPKRGRDFDGIEVSANSGSLGSRGGRVTAGKLWENGWEALVSASLQQSDGNDSFFFPGIGTSRGLDFEKKHSLFASLSYGDFTFQAAHSSRKKGSPALAFETVLNAPDSWVRDEYTVASLKYETTLPGDISFLARALYVNYAYDGMYPYDPSVGKNIDAAEGRSGTLELLLGHKLWEKHHLTLGVEARKIFNADQLAYYIDPDSSYVDKQTSSEEYALFTQGDFELHKRLRLNIGARLDYSEQGGALPSPRIGMVWTPVDGTTLKLVGGRAFRAATAYESFYTAEIAPATHSIPKEESNESLELTLEQKLGTNWQVRLSGYTGRTENVIEFTTAPGEFHYINGKNVRYMGLESELRGRFANGVETRLSYSAQQTTIKHTNSALSNSPQHLAKFQVSAPLIDEKLTVSFDAFASSSVATLRGKREAGYVVANLHLLSADILPGLEISAGIYNLFDAEYAHPSSGEHPLIDRIVQNGRTFGVKATYRF